jgi:hypothetical protein
MCAVLGQMQVPKSTIRKAFTLPSSQPEPKDKPQRATIESFGLDMIPVPPRTNHPEESQFEKLWPGYMLPPWAKKSLNYDVPLSRSICFVHVGKAGGSAVGCSLGFSLHCGNTTQVDGVLPKITTRIFHKDVYNCAVDESHYLFVIRDPIERARSAFNYDRPDPNEGPSAAHYIRYYDDCSFSTFDGMVQDGLSDHGNSSPHCKSLAYHAIRGQGWNSPSHFFYNYQYYFEAVPQNSKIIAIRNEHLNDDWNALEERISGRGDIMNDKSVPLLNVNPVDQDDLYISDESIEILCQALCNEIQVYKMILGLAQNLSEDQVYQSLDALALKCPVEAASDTCPEEMPDISRKLQMNRGYGPDDEETLE